MADFFVTGATGFIGRHLIDRLLNDRHGIRCLVRSEHPMMKEYPEIRYIHGELNDADRYVGELVDVDYVIHMAAIVSSRRPEDYHRVNVEGTRTLLEACRRNGHRIRRFLYMSSIAAVGAKSENALLTENDQPQPDSVYGKSKLRAEQEVLRYSSEIPMVVLRPAFIYGPGDVRGLNSLKLLSEQDELISFRLIETASLCYVSDLVSACFAALTKPVSSGEIFNISDPNVYTWKQIHEILGSVVREVYPEGKENNFIFKRIFDEDADTPGNARRGNPQRKYWGCSIDKARRVLGFQPQYTLLGGARETIQWYRDH
ncbi:MAG: NAD(P)-dependent oxidoreductase, partial [Candidatus Zixiibacteriota bacterium]